MRSYQLVTKPQLKRARTFIYGRDKNKCRFCKTRFKGNPDIKKNIDHIIPRSAFAWSHPFNLQLLCNKCNEEKGDQVLPNILKILRKNIIRTANWVNRLPPRTGSEEESLNLKIRNVMGLTLECNFEKH